MQQHMITPMVDLKSQYLRYKTDIDAAIQSVLDSAMFIKGPHVKQFEQDLSRYLQVHAVVGCANGTDAIQIAMMALGLKPGDEVLLPVFTYVATAEVMGLLGLKPVMVDVDPDTFNIDIGLLASKLTPKTKAIVPVHLFGQCADMEPLLAFAQKHQLFVIEDTAQALGAMYRFDDGRQARAGCMGDIGTTSFFPSKNLGCFGDGGALMTPNPHLESAIRKIANHGQSIQYTHEVIGVNSRLDTLQAAILGVKLQHLDAFEQARQTAASWYDERLKDIEHIRIPKRNPKSTHVFHQYTLVTHGLNRDELRAKLALKGVSSMVYYPIPLNEQQAFAPFVNPHESFPVSTQLCKSVLSLPIHTEMTESMVDQICEILIQEIQSL